MPSDEPSNRQASVQGYEWIVLHRLWSSSTTKGSTATRWPGELNCFYFCFEASNTEACIRASAVLEDCVIMLSIADVSKTFKQVHSHGRRARRITRMCTPSIHWPTGKCLHWHFQSVPERVCNTNMFQADHPVPKNTKAKCWSGLTSTALSKKPYTHSNVHTVPTAPQMM